VSQSEQAGANSDQEVAAAEAGEAAQAEPPFQATFEPELEDKLGRVEDPLELYLEEASFYRPISTGDVFLGVPVPGSTSEERASRLSMVLSHPSAMRKGPELEKRARAAPVVSVPDENFSATKYTVGYSDLFSLPRLGQVVRENGHDLADERWATLLNVTGTIETGDLDVRRRVVCLSPKGVTLLLQKLVNSDTRAAVRLDTIERVIEPKLEELEQLQTWNEALAAPKVDAGADLEVELRAVAHAFDEAMSPLAPLLGDPLRRGEVRRKMGNELRERLG
jgi:hypothetical protein